MYFEKLPDILYNFPIRENERETFVVLKDITANVRFIAETLSNVTIYDLYNIVDGETPEMISDKFYDTPKYHWAIMLANLRFDYINDFPMTYDRLQQYTLDKYGDLYAIHHYEDENGFTVNDDYPLATPIDNITYEDRVNESKRTIKILSKDLLNQLNTEFNNIFKV